MNIWKLFFCIFPAKKFQQIFFFIYQHFNESYELSKSFRYAFPNVKNPYFSILISIWDYMPRFLHLIHWILDYIILNYFFIYLSYINIDLLIHQIHILIKIKFHSIFKHLFSRFFDSEFRCNILDPLDFSFYSCSSSEWIVININFHKLKSIAWNLYLDLFWKKIVNRV